MGDVVQLAPSNLRDIPALLEDMAAKIRSGEFGPITSAAGVFLSGDEVIVCGWGDTDGVHSIGVLNIGAAWLSNRMVSR